MVKLRQSNFELLRLVTMLLIVIHHFAVHGTYQVWDHFTATKIAVDLLAIGGKMGVNIFIMLSAYFIHDKQFRMHRIIKVILDVYVFSLIVLVGLLIYHPASITNDMVYTALFPFPHNYLFVTHYLLLLAVTPILNHCCNRLTEQELRHALLFLLVVLGLLSYLRLESFYYAEFMWFVYLYLIVVYLKTYQPRLVTDLRLANQTVCIGIGLILVSILWHNIAGIFLSDKLLLSQAAIQQYSLPNLIAAVGIFAYFMQIKIKSTQLVKGINFFAKFSFGIFLIHENPILRPKLWGVINNARAIGFLNMVIYGVLISIAVFLVCLLIAMIKYLLFEPLLNRISYKLGNYIDSKLMSKIYPEEFIVK